MRQNQLIDSVILMVLLIGLSAFPVNLLVHDMFWYYVIEALLMLAALIFILFYENRHPETIPHRYSINKISLLILLPLVLTACSNFFYALFLKEQAVPTFETYHFAQLGFIVINVIVEEFVFRRHLLGNLFHPKKIVRILISAGVFALCHLTLFFSTFNPFDLIPVAYAFGLGIMLGFIYCYGNSFIACIVFHLLFNLINDFLFERLFFVNDLLWYFLINGIIALLAGIYLLVIYFFKFEPKQRKSPTYRA